MGEDDKSKSATEFEERQKKELEAFNERRAQAEKKFADDRREAETKEQERKKQMADDHQAYVDKSKAQHQATREMQEAAKERDAAIIKLIKDNHAWVKREQAKIILGQTDGHEKNKEELKRHDERITINADLLEVHEEKFVNNDAKQEEQDGTLKGHTKSLIEHKTELD